MKDIISQKAKETADRLFPGEKWKKWEDGIYVSERRKTGGKTNFVNELKDAQILRDAGYIVYLVPEIRNSTERQYDAIVNGLQMEFKNVKGNKTTLTTQFLNSRTQAPNVFINLEGSVLTPKKIISILYGARNCKSHTDKKSNIIKGYDDITKFNGGIIILKFDGQNNLKYLNVDDLMIKKRAHNCARYCARGDVAIPAST